MNRKKFKELNNLSPNEYIALRKSYYETNEKADDLIKKFNLVGVSPSQLYLIFDDVETDIKCPYCGAFMRHKPPSRTTREASEWFCPNCDHVKYRYDHSLCYCHSCRNLRKTEFKNFLERETSKEHGDIENLKMCERLFLGALVYCNKYFYKSFCCYQTKEEISFFDNNMELDIVISIYKEKCIVISPQNKFEDHYFNRDNKLCKEEFFINPHLFFNLLFDCWLDEPSIMKLIKGEIIDKKDIKKLWEIVNINEAVFYLKKIFDGYYIKNYTDDQIKDIVFSYMDAFSLSETISALSYVTSMHANDIQTKRVTRKDAIQEIIVHLCNYCKWAKTNRDKLKQYARKVKIKDLTRTTQYFYEVVLKNAEYLYINHKEKDFAVDT